MHNNNNTQTTSNNNNKPSTYNNNGTVIGQYTISLNRLNHFLEFH